MLVANCVDPRDLDGFHEVTWPNDVLDLIAPEGPFLTARLKGERYCIRTGCRNERIWRGMCVRCAAYEFRRVINGYVTWETLESVSRALPDNRPAPIEVLRAAKPYLCCVPHCYNMPQRGDLCDAHYRHLHRLMAEGASREEAMAIVTGHREARVA